MNRKNSTSKIRGIKKISLVIILLLVLSKAIFAQDGTTPAERPSNWGLPTNPNVKDPTSGTEANPYKISTLGNLRWMSGYNNSTYANALVPEWWINQNTHVHFLQTKDIYADDSIHWDSNFQQGFIPIGVNVTIEGENRKHFVGVYDGKNYRIIKIFQKNDHIASNTEDLGLFGYIANGSTVKNLKLVDINMSTKGEKVLISVGGLSRGVISSTIENCFISGKIEIIHSPIIPYPNNNSKRINAGGIVGSSYNSFIENSASEVKINGVINVGGGDRRIDIGGIVGYINDTTIKNCYSRSEITGRLNTLNGSFGILFPLRQQNLGGIAGSVDNNSMIQYTYFANNVSGSNHEGDTSNVTINRGGIIGRALANSSSVESSRWNRDFINNAVGSQSYPIPISIIDTFSLSTEEMKESTYFSSWDFTNIWKIDERINEGYPVLQNVTPTLPDDGYHPYAPQNVRGYTVTGGVRIEWDAPATGWPTFYRVKRDNVTVENEVLGFSQRYVVDYHPITQETGITLGYTVEAHYTERVTTLNTYSNAARSIEGKNRGGLTTLLVGAISKVVFEAFSTKIHSGLNTFFDNTTGNSIVSNNLKTALDEQGGGIHVTVDQIVSSVIFYVEIPKIYDAPGSFYVEPQTDGATLYWNHPNYDNGNVKNYIIYRNGVYRDETPDNTYTSISDGGLISGNVYQYHVRAIMMDDEESKPSIIDSTRPYRGVPPKNFNDQGAGLTKDFPFLIETFDNLRWLSEWNSDRYVHSGWWISQNTPIFFEQIKDIDASPSKNMYPDGRGFRPIGHEAQKGRILFVGEYDGGGHKITGLYIDATIHNNSHAGLFGVVTNDSVIENLHLEDVYIVGPSVAGGIAAEINNGSSIKNCSVNGIIVGGSSAGGLVGFSEEGIIEQCYSMAGIGGNTAGGLVGTLIASTIINSYVNSEIISEYRGGTAGIIIGSSILKSYTILTQVSEGVRTEDNNTTDGMISGSVLNVIDSVIENNFYSIKDMEISKVRTFGFINISASHNNNLGLPALQLKEKATFENAGWDFEKIWTIDPDKNFGYPYLQSRPNVPLTQRAENLSGIIVDGQVSLEWVSPFSMDINENIAGYLVYRNGELLDATTETLFIDLNVEDNNIYEYFVTVVYNNPEGESAPSNKLSIRVEEHIEGRPSNYNTLNAGTETNPYLITTLDNLRWLSEHTSDWFVDLDTAIHFKQTANIDATETINWNGGYGFTPIFHIYAHDYVDWVWHEYLSFYGVYDGDNFEISNLYMQAPQDDWDRSYMGGFFRSVKSSTIKNLRLENINISGFYETGGIAGNIMGASLDEAPGTPSIIDNCHVSGTLNGSTVGGIAGVISVTEMINCSSTVDISGSSVGGLVGSVNYNSLISNSHSSATISSSGEGGEMDMPGGIGGIAGSLNGGTILKSYFTGSISSVGGERFGGITGNAGYNSSIQESYFMGEINYAFSLDSWMMPKIGGISGGMDYYSTIKNNYARGTITIIGSGFSEWESPSIGGIIGSGAWGESQVEYNYSATNIIRQGTGFWIGGIVGNPNGSSFSFNIWDTQTTNVSTAWGTQTESSIFVNNAGLTTAQMKVSTNYTSRGWDFVNIWAMNTIYNDNYPYLLSIPPIDTNILYPPTNLSANIVGNNVVLTWNSPVNRLRTEDSQRSRNVSLYKIYRNGNFIAETNNLTYTDANVPEGAYTYSVTALYPQGESLPISIYVTINPAIHYPPTNLLVNVFNTTVDLEWSAAGAGQSFSHTNYQLLGNLGSDGPSDMLVAQRFDANQLISMGLAGQTLSKVRFMKGSLASSATAVYTIHIWVGGVFEIDLAPNPGTLVRQQQVYGTEGVGNTWIDVELLSPLVIPYHQELWIGYRVVTPGGGYSVAVDAGPAVDGYGNLVFSGTTWTTLNIVTNPSLSANFMIEGYASVASISDRHLSVPSISDRHRINGETPSVQWRSEIDDTINGETPLVRSAIQNFNMIGIGSSNLPHATITERSIIETQNQSTRDNRERSTLLGYRVYRNDILLTPNPISQLNFTEYNAPFGTHIYSVRAQYSTGESTAISQTVTVHQPLDISYFPWFEGFENTEFPPSGWQRTGISIGNWSRVTPNSFNPPLEDVTSSGNGAAMSRSWANGALNPDNWLITPRFMLPINRDIELSFYVRSSTLGNYGAEHYSVYISTNTNNLSDFVTEIHSETLPVNGQLYQPRNLDLSNYAGQNIYIAFRHHNCTDQDFILLDDIMIEAIEAPVILYPPVNVASVVSGENIVVNWEIAGEESESRTDGVSPSPVAAISDRHRTDGVSPSSVAAISDRHINGETPSVRWRSEIAATINGKAPLVQSRNATFLHFRVYRNGTFINQTNNLTYTDITPTKDITYIYSVMAVYTEGNSDIVPAEPVFLPIFNPIRNLEATLGDTNITLTWTAPLSQNHGTVSSYRISKNSTYLTETTNTNYIDTNIVAGNEYSYSVLAVYNDLGGQSQPSNTPPITVPHQGALAISPNPFDFGDVIVGETVSQTFTITNNGGSPVVVSSINFSADSVNHFVLTNTNNLPISIIPNQNITVSVSFTPQTVGEFSDNLVIVDNVSGVTRLQNENRNREQRRDAVGTERATHFVHITGRGIAPIPQCVTITAPTIAYEVPLNQVISWTPNPSGGAPTGYKIYFGFTSQPPLVNSNYTSTSWTPTPALVHNTTYYFRIIPFNQTGEPTNCPIWSFTTIPAPPLIFIDPSSINFGSVFINNPSTSHTITIANNGGTILNINEITITDTNANEFSRTNPSTTSINPGGSTSFSVTFTPQSAGVRNAVVNISHNASGSPHQVQLTGTGESAAITSFPFIEDFNGNSLPYGWINNGGWWFFDGYTYNGNSTNLLITPRLQLPYSTSNSDMTLIYNVATENLTQSTTYEVLVSTTGTANTDFTYILRETVSNDAWVTRSIKLTQYEGQSIYIAFRRISGNFTDIDDIWVGDFNYHPPRNLAGSVVNTSIQLAWQAPVGNTGIRSDESNEVQQNRAIKTPRTTTYDPDHVEIGIPITLQNRQNVLSSIVYKIYRNNAVILETENLTYTDNNIIIGTDYTYQVSAYYNEADRESPRSNSVGPLQVYPVPLVATNPNPIDNAIDVPLNQVLSWSANASGSTPTGYKLYFGTTNPPTLISNNYTPTTWIPTPALVHGMTYYWQIVPFNTTGDAENCPVWMFTTIPPVPLHAINPNPADNAVDVPLNQVLQWANNSQGSTPTGYKLYFGTKNPPPLIYNNYQTTSWTPTPALVHGTIYYWQIIPFNNTGDAVSCPVWTFTTILPVPPIATNPNPNDNAVDVPLNQVLSWSPNPSGSTPTGYKLHFGTTNPPPLVNNNYTQTSWTPVPSLVHGTTYYWQIIPFNNTGDAVDCPIWSFTTIPPVPLQAINPDPSSGSIDVPLNQILSWSPNSSGSTPTGYKLHFGTTNPPPLVNNNYTQTSWTPAPALVQGAIYYWQIIPFNTTGDAVDCPIWSFTTLLPEPLFAINPNPIHNAVDVPLNQVLSWSANASGSTPTGYKLHFGTTNPPPLVNNNFTQTSWTPTPALVHGTTYYWQIVPFNTTDDAVDCPIWSFTTLLPEPLFAINPNPIHNAVDVPLNQVLSWSPNLSGSTPIGYKLHFGTTNPPPLLNNNYTQTSWTPAPTLAHGMIYYWQIVPFNNTGDAADCPVWTFTTIPPVPLQAINPNPAGNAVEVPLNQVLQWANNSQGSTPTGYKLHFGTTNPLPLLNDNYTQTSWTPAPTLAHGMIYYWQIVPFNNTGDAADCPVWTFTTIPPVPLQAINPNPVNNSVDVPLNQVLSWSPNLSGSTPIGYKLHFGTTNPPPLVNNNFTQISWAPNPALTYDTNYYWQIIPFNNTGDAVNCPVWTFTTIPPVPLAAINPNPVDNAQMVPLNQVLQWVNNSQGSTPTGYKIYFGTSPNPPLVVSNATTTTWTPSPALTYGTTYYWQIIPFNATGDAENCSIWSFTTIPPVPLYAINPNPADNDVDMPLNQVLSWSPNTSGSSPTGYKLHFGTTNPPPLINNNYSSATWEPTSDLMYGTTYFWQIVPFNNTGDAVDCPVWSFTTIYNMLPVRDLLGRVINMTTVHLLWLPPEQEPQQTESTIGRMQYSTMSIPGLIGYNVYCDGVLLNSSPIEIETYFDINKSLDTSYTYTVTAVYISGESDPEVKVIIVPKFNPIRELEANVIEQEVILSWDAPDYQNYGDIIGYRVSRDGEEMSMVSTLGFTDETVFEGTEYTYSIVVLWEVDEIEGFSESVNVEVYVPEPEVLLPVQNLTGRVIGMTTVHLLWEAPDYGSQITLSMNDKRGQSTIPNFIGYNVYCDGVLLNSIPIDEDTYFDIDKTPDTSYAYTVTVVYVSGESEPEEKIIIVPIFNPIRELSANVENQEVLLSWEKPDNQNYGDLIGYRISRDGIEMSMVSTLDFIDETVLEGTEYTYSIVVLWEVNEIEGMSEAVDIEVYVPEPELLLPPVNVLFRLIDNNSKVLIVWEVPDSEPLGYNVYREETLLTVTPIENTDFLDDTVTAGTYIYSVSAVYNSGESERVYSQPITSEDDVSSKVHLTQLLGNYPNPFNPETIITFVMGKSAYVTIEIFNIRGQRIRTIFEGMKDSGEHEATWNGLDMNGREVGSGIYLYVMKTDGFSDVKRMVLLK